jgi:hypothetical protein
MLYCSNQFQHIQFWAFATGTGVLESLRPASDPSFDFSPSDVFQYRTGNVQYHIGDLTFRYRDSNGSAWSLADTAATRSNNTALTSSSSGSFTSNLNQAFGNLSSSLNVTRTWSQKDGDLTLAFTIQNTGPGHVEIGSLGMPIEFNNIFTDRTSAKGVFLDPYIGLHAGYVQVTRLTGTGPNLVITPLNSETKFEAWRFLAEPTDVPLGYQIQTYEGNYAWEVFTLAYAKDEWRNATPWNPPTSMTLQGEEEVTRGLRFSIAEQVQEIEETVASIELPVAVGIPGYVLPQDLVGKLFVNATQTISSIDVEPKGALAVMKHDKTYAASWTGFDVQASNGTFGRVGMVITYEGSITQAVHYWVAHSGPTALDQLGEFLTPEQWFTNTSDPFGRAPSVITYDREFNQYVPQDNRTWIAGLSDEGGAGSFLAACMKQSVYPVAEEVAKLKEFVHEVVWGRLQISSGSETYAVHKSLFYYQPDHVYDPFFNWTSVPGETWNKTEAYLTVRTYDYVHVSALYWGLYRAGRTHPGYLTQQSPEWYLLQAYHTVVYAISNGTDGTPHTQYWNVGLMGETVRGQLLSDLQSENYTTEATTLISLMLARQQLWAGAADPYGSEMAWDSTGEEGVYLWSDYFHDNITAQKTIDAIRGYMPTIAHWGWNGNARRY